MKSKLIALSAVSAGFVALCLTLGSYFTMIDIAMMIFASAFSILPMYYNSKLGAFLSALVGVVIAFLFSGFNIMSLVFPCFVLFFGTYPTVYFTLKEKKVKKVIMFFIGLIWCVAISYGAYYYDILIIGEVFNDLPVWLVNGIIYFVGIFGAVFFVLYFRFVDAVKILADKYLHRIIK